MNIYSRQSKEAILFLICVLYFSGCAPIYQNSAVMNNVGKIQESKAGSEYFSIEPDFQFKQDQPVVVSVPRFNLKDTPISSDESQFYAEALQEKLTKMFSDLGIKTSENSTLILETSFVRLLIPADFYRKSFGLMGATLNGPVVEIEGAVYEVRGNDRRKVFAFYERGSKGGGSFINNLNGEELAIATIDDLVNKNLRNIVQKNTEFTTSGYSQFRIKEMGLARDVSVYNVLLKMGVNISGKGDTFHLSDKELQWYATFESENLSQILVNRHFRAVWYTPDGSIYQDQNFNVSQGNSLVARNKLKLDTSRKDLIGKWQVKVYEDDQPMDDRFFTVIGDVGLS